MDDNLLRHISLSIFAEIHHQMLCHYAVAGTFCAGLYTHHYVRIYMYFAMA